MTHCCGSVQCAAVTPGAGVGLHRAKRVASRLRVQAQVLAACKVGAAHSLVALASVLAFMASTDTNASATPAPMLAFAAAGCTMWVLPLLLLLLLLPLLLLGLVASSS